MASARLFASGCRSLLSATKTSTAASASGADAVTAAAAAVVKPKARAAAVVKPKARAAASAKAKREANADKPAKPRGRPLGIMKPLPISAAFQQFLGVSEVSRGDAVKEIWAYIKKENLQNPENKREIQCDEKLKTIFDGKEKVGFLEIASLISKHFRKAE